MNPPENVKRFGILILVFTAITYICTYVTFVYSILAYFGYLLVSLILAWQITKYYRTTFRPKEFVESSDKAVFITGCDTGFGNILAANLDKLGFTVFAGCLFPDKEGAQNLAKRCSKRLTIVKLDVTDQESVEDAAKFVENNLSDKKLWALVNNAGIIDYCGIESGSSGIGSFSRQMDVNVYGLVRTTKCFLPLLRNTSQSRVILLGSVAGRFVGPSMCGYAMSKFAVRAFGEGLRREMKQLNVYVSVIEPTFYNTAISDEKITLNTLDKNWDSSPDHIKQSYGHLHEPHRDIIKLFVRTRHSRIEDVTDTITEAIRVPEPEFYYRISYFFDKITNLMDYCPEEMNDIIVNETVGPSVLRFIGYVNERFEL